MTSDSVDPITIVSGLPRSGTSMMMKMLEAGGIPVLIDGIREADEDNPNGYYEFEAVKKTKEDATWITDARGKVVKMVYRLLYDLPTDIECRVVFMRRKMEEVLASQKKMLDRNGKSNAVTDEQLSVMFQSQIAKFDEWVKTQPQIKLLTVWYNDLLSEAVPEVARINEFLGGKLETAAMLGVVDSSLYRNRS